MLRAQIDAAKNPTVTLDTYEYTLPYYSQRGEIYDRNGVALVTNAYTDTLCFEYSAMSCLTFREQNTAILNIIDAVAATGGGELDISSFPLIGSYPYLGYDYEKLGEGSTFSRLKSVLVALELIPKGDAGELMQSVTLDALIEAERGGYEIKFPSAEELISALCKKYRLTSVDEDEIRFFTNPEVDRLLAVRYGMEAAKFAPFEPYAVLRECTTALKTYIREHEIPGVMFRTEASRVYEYPGYMSHILGRTGKIPAEEVDYYISEGYPLNATVGISGVERAFEEYLHGRDGEITYTVDENGVVISSRITKSPIAGSNVYLTLDLELQMEAEDALADNIEYIIKRDEYRREHISNYESIYGKYYGHDCDSGAIVAVDPRTGEVLAMASNPTFDLSTFAEDYDEIIKNELSPMLNRATDGAYPPGSTFKVGMALAALGEGIVDKSSLIECTGSYKYYVDVDPTFKPKCTGVHGKINVVTALGKSCNCYFFDVGRQLGIDTINRYCTLYGFGQRTGIELGESTGLLATPEYLSSIGQSWSAGATVYTAIGQGHTLVTPAQLASYISTVINGGNRYGLHLLGSVREFGTGEIIYASMPTVLSSVNITSGDYKTLIEGMREVTTDGDSKKFFKDFAVSVGGKTGTAEIDPEHRSNNGIFISFAPLDEPEIAISCIINKAATGVNCGYSAMRILAKYFDLDINTDYTKYY